MSNWWKFFGCSPSWVPPCFWIGAVASRTALCLLLPMSGTNTLCLLLPSKRKPSSMPYNGIKNKPSNKWLITSSSLRCVASWPQYPNFPFPNALRFGVGWMPPPCHLVTGFKAQALYHASIMVHFFVTDDAEFRAQVNYLHDLQVTPIRVSWSF